MSLGHEVHLSGWRSGLVHSAFFAVFGPFFGGIFVFAVLAALLIATMTFVPAIDLAPRHDDVSSKLRDLWQVLPKGLFAIVATSYLLFLMPALLLGALVGAQGGVRMTKAAFRGLAWWGGCLISIAGAALELALLNRQWPMVLATGIVLCAISIVLLRYPHGPVRLLRASLLISCALVWLAAAIVLAEFITPPDEGPTQPVRVLAFSSGIVLVVAIVGGLVAVTCARLSRRFRITLSEG
jgi:hypothetical protein